VREALTARLLRRDGHTTYTLDADATLIEGENGMRTGATERCAATCRCSGFCGRRACVWWMSFGGNVSPGAGQIEFYRQCRAQMPTGKRLARYRADSASYQAALINEWEADQDVAVKP